MKRDFALRVDSLLEGVRVSLTFVIEHMKGHISRGDLTEEEWHRYSSFLVRSMTETMKMSNDLHAAFPDIIPDEVKGNRKSN